MGQPPVIRSSEQIQSELKWVDRIFDVLQVASYVPLIAVLLNNSYEAFVRHESFYGFAWAAFTFGVLVRFTRLCWEFSNFTKD